eukprot:4481969-Prymnesium_polylepis.1
MIAELGRIHDDVHAHTLSALSVAFDPNDDFVCSGSADTSVKLWRVGDKECAHDMLGHLDWVTKVVRRWHQSGVCVCGACVGGGVCLFECVMCVSV